MHKLIDKILLLDLTAQIENHFMECNITNIMVKFQESNSHFLHYSLLTDFLM